MVVVQFNLILAGISPDWGGLVSWRSSLLFIQIFQIFSNVFKFFKYSETVSSADVVGLPPFIQATSSSRWGGRHSQRFADTRGRVWFVFSNISNIAKILMTNVGMMAPKNSWIFHISQIFCRHTRSRVDGSRIFSNISNILQTNLGWMAPKGGGRREKRSVSPPDNGFACSVPTGEYYHSKYYQINK